MFFLRLAGHLALMIAEIFLVMRTGKLASKVITCFFDFLDGFLDR